MEVTQNLEILLWRLRSLPDSRSDMSFWIDGLCINQDDISEKNHQVGLMKRIYSQSLSTIVWLGAADTSSDHAMDALQSGPGSGADWQAVLTLWARSYFNRMWIVQELALNKNLSMLICGEKTISRRVFLRHCGSVPSRSGVIAEMIAANNQTNTGQTSIDQDYVWSLATKVKRLLLVPAFGTHPEWLLDLASKSFTTDPRDKIYGLLGLLPDFIVARVDLDYAKPKGVVYLEFASQMLDQCTRLDEALSWCTFTGEISSFTLQPR